MKIIKHGDVSRIRESRFECPYCGCIFEAQRKEYSTYNSQREDRTWAETYCPECSSFIKKDLPHCRSDY